MTYFTLRALLLVYNFKYLNALAREAGLSTAARTVYGGEQRVSTLLTDDEWFND